MVNVRLKRMALLTTTGVLLTVAAWEFVFLWSYVGAQGAIGTDLAFFVSVGQRWLDTGQLYLAHQLTGAYVVRPDVDILYPPIALLLFVPFVWLPFPLWWAVPLATMAAAFARWRPAMWTWPLLALGLAWPRTLSRLIYGNTDMWLVAMIAAGFFVGWTAVVIVIKPSFAPFAIVGVRHRSWWLAAALVGVASLALLDLWREYVVAIRNSNVDLTYSLVDLPTMLIPIVAWLGRRDGGLRGVDDLRRRWRSVRVRGDAARGIAS